ncbi:MAG: hypothetical protein EOP04_04630 [Proteobacteria bacterium]|nr:MAG: hypothetical protein EOP04_04630 [Pseudomonadota bacterium]
MYKKFYLATKIIYLFLSIFISSQAFSFDALVPVSEKQAKGVDVYSSAHLKKLCLSEPNHTLCKDFVSLTPSMTNPNKVSNCDKTPNASECRIVNQNVSVMRTLAFTDFACSQSPESCDSRLFAKCEDIYGQTAICDLVKQCDSGMFLANEDPTFFIMRYQSDINCPAISRGLNSCALGNETSCLTLSKIEKNWELPELIYTCPTINNELEISHYKSVLDKESFAKISEECEFSKARPTFVQPTVATVVDGIENKGILLTNGLRVPYNSLLIVSDGLDPSTRKPFPKIEKQLEKSSFKASSNISPVPIRVREYKFPGYEGSISPLTFNYTVKLMDWTYLAYDHLNVGEYELSCSVNDMKNMVVTDRRSLSLYFHDPDHNRTIYQHEFALNRPTPSVEMFFEEKKAALSKIPSDKKLILTNWGPDLFIDSSPKPSTATPSFFSNLASPRTCQIGLGDANQIPTDVSLAIIRGQAVNLKSRLELQAQLYASARANYQLKKFTRGEVEKNSLATLKAIQGLLKAAFDGECNEVPALPDFLSEVLIPDNAVSAETCNKVSRPSDYGLVVKNNDWSEIDLISIGVVAKNLEKGRYVLNLLNDKNKWYDDFRREDPRLAEPLAFLMQIYVDLLSTTLIDEQATAVEIEIENFEKIRKKLAVEIQNAKEFVEIFRQLSKQLELELNDLADDIVEENTTLDTPI